MKWRVATASLLMGAFSAVPVLAVPALALAAEPPTGVRLQDPRITESSGLVDLGPLWVTSNDSGDGARLFVISPRTGKTIGITTLRAPVEDVEALAPAGTSAVWVADIGDNRGTRRTISVYRVTVGTGRMDVTPRRYQLVYPRGRPDAEALFVDRQGRLHIVTKAFAGGVVFRAPARLSSSRPNRLTPVARVRELATDAARTRDGRHVIIRSPFQAGVYTLPGFQRVASLPLPLQPQGEGISVGPTGTIRVSSEGARSVVRRVTVPAAVQRLLAPAPKPTATSTPTVSPSPSASPAPSPSTTATPAASGASSSSGEVGALDSPWLMWTIPAVIAVGAIGIGYGLRRRAE